jgi:hypothetical protein
MIFELVFICLVGLINYLVYKFQKRREASLKYNIIKYNNSYTTTVGEPLDGVFEIHITVDPENDFAKLIKFVDKYKKKGLKIVYAVSSEKINQYMISYFTRKEDEMIVIKTANELGNQINNNGIKVIRIKVEGHNAKGTPMTTKDYELFKEYIIKRSDPDISNHVANPYFEFHVKVGGNKYSPDYYEKLEDAVKGLEGVAISYNMCSANRKPLLTIRVYNDGFLLANAYKDSVMNTLKNMGFSFDDKIQQEFSIYDTNSKIDDGWLVWQ